MDSSVIYASVALITVCYLSDWLFSLWDDPREPPRAKPRVPLIGHLIGLMKSGTVYYTQVSAQQTSEVYTVGIFNYKIYVINSRRIIPLVQRLSKTLSFTPFQQFAVKTLVGCSSYTVDLHGNPSFMRDLDKATRVALFPGPQLDYQNLRAANSLNDSLDELLLRNLTKEPVRFKFYDWSRHAISLAATNGVYGDSNPYIDKKIEDAFWTWNDGFPNMMAGLAVFARKGLTARHELVHSFKEYLSSGYQDAAEITKERIRVMSEYNVPKDDIARMQAGFSIALLANTAPTAFWTLFNIFSRPVLLQQLRAELEDRAVLSNGIRSGRNAEFEIDVVALKTKCTLLLSILEETQRTVTVHANIRKVRENTTLDKYYLQKGNYVQIPNAPILQNAELWGEDPFEFNPGRFIKNDGMPLSSSLPSNSFLAWGTAPHLCPARQFAATEILVMVSLLVLRTEIVPVGGKWERPEMKYGDLAGILPPKKDVDVIISTREGWTGNWNLKMGESKLKVPLTSG